MTEDNESVSDIMQELSESQRFLLYKLFRSIWGGTVKYNRGNPIYIESGEPTVIDVVPKEVKDGSETVL